MRKALPAELKLAVALRFFASGDIYVSLSYNWRVGNNTLSVLVCEVAMPLLKNWAKNLYLCHQTLMHGSR